MRAPPEHSPRAQFADDQAAYYDTVFSTTPPHNTQGIRHFYQK